MTTPILVLVSILISCFLAIFMLNSIINSKIKNKLSEKENPITVSILKAVMFTSIGLLLSEVVTVFQSLLKILPLSYSENDLLRREIMFFAIYVGIIFVHALIVLWVGAIIFGIISKGKNIFIETANNNLNAVVLFCGIVLALTLAAKTGVTPLLDQFITYPTMPIYH